MNIKTHLITSLWAAMKLEHDYSMGRQCHASYNHSSATRTYNHALLPLINAENGSNWGLSDAGGMIHPGW